MSATAKAATHSAAKHEATPSMRIRTGVAGRPDEARPEASRVVVGAEARGDLELTVVARSSIDVAELARAGKARRRRRTGLTGQLFGQRAREN